MSWDPTPTLFQDRKKKSSSRQSEVRGCPYHIHWITPWLQSVWWEGHLVSGMCPAGRPLSCSSLLTAVASALVLTRGQVAASQASARCAAGGIPAAQCWQLLRRAFCQCYWHLAFQECIWCLGEWWRVITIWEVAWWVMNNHSEKPNASQAFFNMWAPYTIKN